MHTFPGQDLTSCTLFQAVFRFLCTLSLHLLHTVRPPTGCPVPPDPPFAQPAWNKMCLVYLISASGLVARPTACCSKACTQACTERCGQVHPRPATGVEATTPLFRLNHYSRDIESKRQSPAAAPHAGLRAPASGPPRAGPLASVCSCEHETLASAYHIYKTKMGLTLSLA